MSGAGVGYDLSCPTFSPNGKIYQVEYAAKTAKESGLVLGASCKDGVVLAVEKIMNSPMLEAGAHARIFSVARYAGLAVAGFLADGRALANQAREEASGFRKTFSADIPLRRLNDAVAGHMHSFTLHWDKRPYGAAALLAGLTADEGAQLYAVDNSGASFRCFAYALGKNADRAKTELGKRDFSEMAARDAVDELAEIVYRLHDDVKEKDFELEMSWVTEATQRKHQPLPNEVLLAARVKGAEARRKQDLDEDSEQSLKILNASFSDSADRGVNGNENLSGAVFVLAGEGSAIPKR